MRSVLRPLVLVASVLAAGAPGATAADTLCPASNPPNTIRLAGGTPQTAKLRSPFAAPLEVMLANTNGCPVTTGAAGVAVTFTAPTSGAGGTFAASGSNSVTVGANASGLAAASQFTANGSAGSYTVIASSDYGSVEFTLTNTASGVAASLAAAGAASQSATVGTHYPEPLRVKLLDANGNPVQGATITFLLGATNGAGAVFDGGGSQATELTDDAGVATSPLFAANGVAGGFTASASAAGIVQPVTFALRNLAGKPPTIAAAGSKARSATVKSRYRSPLEVKVRDANGGPVQGATVIFSLGTSTGGASGATAVAGGSFVGGSTQATAVTDADGVATSPLVDANEVAGRFTATASMSSVREPVTFTLENLAAKQPTIAVVGGAQRSTTVGSRFAEPLRVRVLDGAGKPLQGASVTFSLGEASAGGSGGTSTAQATFLGGSTQATETTDATGRATSPALLANDVAGKLTATATTSGTTQAATFSLRNLAGKATTVTPGVAASARATTGAALPVRLAVTVKDDDDNPVSGVMVTFVAPTRGPSGRFGAHGSRIVHARTNADGIAVAPTFKANAKVGGYVVRATVRGVPRPAAFALVNERLQ